MKIRRITTPFDDGMIESLHAGDKILLNGIVYTARDSAHKRIVEAIVQGRDLPFDLSGQVVYYCGPSPSAPGRVIGAAGPTTSSRMDSYAPFLIEHGLKGMIGKGKRSTDVRKAMERYKAVYFGATGGAGALLAQAVETYEVIAYPELGPEAVARLLVKDMPLFVVNDSLGNDLYDMGIERYRTA
jgi:fumarate hydratase subunit beta